MDIDDIFLIFIRLCLILILIQVSERHFEVIYIFLTLLYCNYFVGENSHYRNKGLYTETNPVHLGAMEYSFLFQKTENDSQRNC